MAHPCLTEVEATMGKTLTLHSGGNWAGYMPSFSDLEHECADDLNSYIYQSTIEAAADPVPGVPAGPIVSAAGFAVKNLTPLGHTARNVPFTGTGNGVYNSDLAFKDNYVIAGTYEGFRVLDFTNKSAPVELLNYTGCNVGQGDVIVYGNLVVRSWDAPASASSTCAGQAVGQGFEGVHIFDLTDFYANPATGTPQMVKQLSFTSAYPGLVGCGSHTATAVPDPARGFLYIYNGGSSGNCPGIDIFRISLSNPSDAVVVRRAANGRGQGNSCHDNNVLMGVGGTSIGYAMCAGGNGLSMYKFDMSKAPGEAGTPESPGGVENPTLAWSRVMPSVGVGHSGSFTYDGKILVFGHEPGGGSQAQCQESSTAINKSLYFINPENGDVLTSKQHERHQTNRENCTWHNFNVVPTKGGYYATVGSYQSGISILDFSQALQGITPREIAYADPAPLNTSPPTSGIILGGDWSTYWHNGYIYESDIKRGVTSWQLNLGGDASAAQANEHLKRLNTYALSNPQTQMGSYAVDSSAPTITVASPAEGAGFKLGSTMVADFDCGDDKAIESCVGTAADGASMTMSSLGKKTFRVTATDTAGNVTTKDVAYMVNSVDYTLNAGGGNVDSMMALTLPSGVNLGSFTPGRAFTYESTASSTITSTAGDLTLSVYDAATTGTGRLVNGPSTLTSPLQIFGSATQGTALAGGNVGGASAPTQVISFAAPQLNRTTTLFFRQPIAANEVLRSGAYTKTLTFTLSSTTP